MWTLLRTLLVQRVESAEPSAFVRVPVNNRFGPIRAEIRVGTLVLGAGATAVVLTIWRQVGARIDKIRNITVPTADGALAQTVDLYGGDLAVTVKSFPDGSEGSTAAITGAIGTGVIVITCADHGFETGDEVVIADVGGNTAANGTSTITVIDENTFSLDESQGNAPYTTGGTATKDASVKDITGAANTGLIEITCVGHGLDTDDQVLVESVVGMTEANGVSVITKTGNDTFTLNGSAAVNDYTSGGTWLKTSEVLGVSGTVEARSVDPRHLPFGRSLG